MFDSNSYLGLALLMYILIRLMQVMWEPKEVPFIRCLSGVFLVVTMVMMWNVIAENRLDFENWKSYGSQIENTIVEDLGITGEVLKK